MKKTKTVAFSNLICALVFLVLGIWAFFKTFGFQVMKNAYAQPALFPQIMSVGLIIFSLIVIVQSVYKLATMKETDPLAAPTGSLNVLKNKGVQAALLVIILCIAFVALFEVLGYVLASTVIAAIIMWLIGKRDVKQILLVSVLVPLVMWLVFYKLLTVNIPMGVLEFLKDLVDMI